MILTFFSIIFGLATCFCCYLLGVTITKNKVELYIRNERTRIDSIVKQIHWLLERAEPDIQEEFLNKFGRK